MARAPTNADIIREISGLKVEVTTTAEAVREERNLAREHRHAFGAKLETIGEKLNAVAADVQDLKPTVRRLEENRLMAAGAGKFAVLIARIGYALAGAVGAAVVWIMSEVARHGR